MSMLNCPLQAPAVTCFSLLLAFASAFTGSAAAATDTPLPAAAANAAEAPVVFLDNQEEYHAPAEGRPGISGDAAAAPSAAPSVLIDPDRENALRQSIGQNPTAAAYLELLELLGRRLDGLHQGDERLLLAGEVDTLWADALARFGSDPLLLLANGDRLVKRGSLKAAWEAYARGEQQVPRDPRWTMRLGGLRQAAGDYPGAIALYKESLALSHDAAVVAAVAECYRLNGEPAAALDAWNAALAGHPADAALCMAYGQALFAQGSFHEALGQYRRGIQLDPRSDLFHNRAALCLFQLGSTAEAVTEVRQALELRAQPIYYYNLAVGYEELGQYDSAEQWYRSGVAKYPADSQLATGYRGFLADHGRGGEALQQLPVSTSSDNPALDYANRAALAEEQGDLDGAAAAWQAAVAADPTSPVTLTAACAFYARSDNAEALIEQARVARNRLDPEDFAALLREAAQSYISVQDYAGGIGAFTRLLADHPDVPMVYNQLGLLQHMGGDSAAGLATVKRGQVEVNQTSLGRYLEAFLTAKVRGLDAALPLGPELVSDPEADYGAFELYSGLLFDSERYDEAGAVAAAGLAKFPRRGRLLELEARALLGQEKLAEAAELLTGEAFMRLEFRGKARLVGNIQMELGNYPKAVAAFSEAVRGLAADSSPEDASLALSALAEAQCFNREYAAARNSATEALASSPRNSSAQVWLGWALLGLADLPGAVQAFAEAKPDAGSLDILAWLALGQARASAQGGQRADAYAYWQQARSYGITVASPRLDAAIAGAKSDLGF